MHDYIEITYDYILIAAEKGTYLWLESQER